MRPSSQDQGRGVHKQGKDLDVATLPPTLQKGDCHMPVHTPSMIQVPTRTLIRVGTVIMTIAIAPLAIGRLLHV